MTGRETGPVSDDLAGPISGVGSIDFALGSSYRAPKAQLEWLCQDGLGFLKPALDVRRLEMAIEAGFAFPVHLKKRHGSFGA